MYISCFNSYKKVFFPFPTYNKNGSRGKNLDFLENGFPQCVENIVENSKFLVYTYFFHVGKIGDFSTEGKIQKKTSQ
jgi:hypothetical protein